MGFFDGLGSEAETFVLLQNGNAERCITELLAVMV